MNVPVIALIFYFLFKTLVKKPWPTVVATTLSALGYPTWGPRSNVRWASGVFQGWASGVQLMGQLWPNDGMLSWGYAHQPPGDLDQAEEKICELEGRKESEISP